VIEIAELLPPWPTPLWHLVRQCGVRYAVGTLPYPAAFSWMQNHGTGSGGAAAPANEDRPWGYQALLHMKTRFADNGLELAVIESSPPMDQIRLGQDGREAQIAEVCAMIEAMGALGIRVWCYNWMAGINWSRTSMTTPARGGALVSSYDNALMAGAPIAACGPVSEELLWETLAFFLARVLPVAERAGVTLAMHPDDPPRSPLRGIGRIMRSVENFQRLLDMAPSPANALTLCQGNFALMTDDLPGTIRRFGTQGKIGFVHFRDVRGTPESFAETFHDDGPTDMLACLRAYQEIGYQGLLRPDHVPTLEGETNANPGYETLGRLFAIGYIRGLHEAVYGKQTAFTSSE